MAKQHDATLKQISQLLAAGNTQLAELKLSEVIQKNSSNVAALSMLANLHMQKNDILPAIQLLQRAIQLAPSSQMLNNLGVAYRKIGRPDLALPVLRKAIALDGNNAIAYFNYAGELSSFCEFEESLGYFRLAGEKDETLRVAAIAASAGIKERMGLVDEAFADIMNLVEQGHKAPVILRALGNLLQQHKKFNDSLEVGISLLADALEREIVSPHEINSYYFLLGNLYQKRKDYDSAFISFQQGHRYTNYNYDEELELSVVAGIPHLWSAKDDTPLAANSLTKKKFFFIVGMPRSGSTLVEQILAVTPESSDLGECSFFAAALAESVGNRRQERAIDRFRPLSAEEAREIRSLYIRRAFQTRKPTPVLTDKTLNNTLHVGQILQVFPEARIIWTRRDPRDACLSCYTYDFAGSLSYRHDLRTLARYHNQTEKTMRFWQECYPQNVYAACYEEMILNPAEKIRELVDFCDLPWSDDYLRFHQVQRTINTASYNQVTQPIYTSSIGRWKDYEKYLAPLLEELALSSC